MCAMMSVHPIGLSAECQKILSVTLNVLHAGGCGVTLADEVNGETLVVVDVDSDEGRAFYERDHAEHRAVVIASDEKNYRADALIRKPLRVQALRNLLTDLLEHSPEASSDAVISQEKRGTAVAQGMAILPNRSLFYALVNAVTNGVLLKASAADGTGVVLIHGPSRMLYSQLERDEIGHVAALKDEQLSVTPLDEYLFMKEARGLHSQRIERMLWLADAYGACGVAPAPTAEKTVFRLNQWPRFDVKSVNPAYLSLAALMTRNTLSCSAAARMAGLPVETVFNFFHAARACGVVEEPPATVVQSVDEQTIEPIRRSSLVSRIAKKLGINLV